MRKLLLLFCALVAGLQAGAVCTPSFTAAYTNNQYSNNYIVFTNTSTHSGYSANATVAYTVNFGDYNNHYPVFNTTFDHYYAGAGPYTITLTMYVYDSSISTTTPVCTASTSQTITYPPCHFNITQQGQTTTRTYTANNLVNTPGIAYTWNFGDGTPAVTGNTVTHTFGALGNYTVTATSNAPAPLSCSGTATFLDSVRYWPLICDSVVTNLSASLMGGNDYFFTSSLTTNAYAGGFQPSFLFDYGDGTTSPYGYINTHTYTAAGTYNASVIITLRDQFTNAVLCRDTAYTTVTVSPCLFTIAASGTGSSRNFTATSMFSTPGMTYNWDFGDGTTGTGATVTHNYSTAANYTVTCTASRPAPNSCTSSQSLTVPVVGPVNCDSTSVTLYPSYWNGPYVYLLAYTHENAGASGYTRVFDWSYGDGNTSSGTNEYATHTYAAAGTYNTRVVVSWVNTATQTLLCRDTAYAQINIINSIRGYVIKDSVPGVLDSFKVWLIEVDSIANTLTAVDSSITSGYSGVAAYGFTGMPSGRTYLTKAAWINGPSSGPGYIPTYHTNALYWANANPIYLTGVASFNRDILLQQGQMTTGPGFIGGSIALGANKGNGGGLRDVTVILRDAAGTPLQFSTSDAIGQYSFSDLPDGTYSIYPEMLGYATTPLYVTLTSANHNSIENGFIVSNNAKTVVPGSLKVPSNGQSDLSLRVFPNPSEGKVQVRWNAAAFNSQSPVMLSVTDAMGRTVSSQQLNAQSGGQELNLQPLGKGFYWLRLSQDGRQQATTVELR